MLVYILSSNGRPLMPTNRGGRVRYLINNGLAKIVSMKPFTIKLLYETKEITQPLYGGTDPGRANIGEAVVTEDGEAVYMAHVQTRNMEVPKLMAERAAHRRASRQGERKRRQRRAKANGTTFKDGDIQERTLPGCEEPIRNHYITNSEARFNNRKRPKGWLTPTATQLLRTHLNMVDKICRILPVTGWSLEINRFAFMRMEDGSIRGVDFQNGRLKGYDSSEAYIYAEQHGKCACCGQPIEHYHHIVQRSKGGSNGPENLVGLCSDCHSNIHTKGVKSAIAKVGKSKKHAALSVLNQVIPYIYDGLVERFGEENVHICTGYETKVLRESACLQKEHHLDALAIASILTGQKPFPGAAKPYEIKQFRRHDRQIIHAQRERTYKLDGKTIAKNRKPRFEQSEPSLADYLGSLNPAEQHYICSVLKVTASRRYYKDPQRPMSPGCLFLYNGTRYVMTGQSSYGKMLRAYGQGNVDFPAKNCQLVKTGGLVYI